MHSMMRRALVTAALFAGLGLPGGAVAQGGAVTVSGQDDVFNPVELHVAPGTTITWVMDGANANEHTVTADDGSFDSGPLGPGATFSLTVPEDAAGDVQYYCSEHGEPGGHGMAGLIAVSAQQP
jgi:plastocyanin